jgi:hypothetical protein
MSEFPGDPERLARGEPPWGDVLPGTDEVQYYVPVDETLQPTLCRTVAKDGAFYVETYRGNGRWEGDSEPFSWLMWRVGSEPTCHELAPVEAADLMRELDGRD